MFMQTKYLENVKGIVYVPHLENQKNVLRSIVAICKVSKMICRNFAQVFTDVYQKEEDQKKALDAGAETVGSTNLINAIEKGELKVDSFNYLVCHTDSILDAVKLRGLLRKKFPDKKRRNKICS